KQSVLTEIAAVLAFSATTNNDKVGCILFSDKIEKFIPPKKGRSHILMIIHELISFTPSSKGTNIGEAVRYLSNVIKKRCTAFILSDFIEENTSKGDSLSDALKVARNRHDLVGVRLYDPREAELPDIGIVELCDAESGERVWVDTSSKRVRDHYAQNWEARSEKITTTLSQNRVDTATVSTIDDYVLELIKLFKKR
ncbi:MAG: VWA domain-containing protein, partial [Rikenellaceae bacterium]